MRSDTRVALLSSSILIGGFLFGGWTIGHLSTSPITGTAEVIDGDSLRVNGRPIRLAGIDAPEWRQKCFDAQEQEYMCGELARTRLLEIAGRSIVRCSIIGRDIYERSLSFCSVAGRDIGEQMISRGLAIAYGTEGWRYRELESMARRSRIGIWSGFFDEPRLWRTKRGL